MATSIGYLAACGPAVVICGKEVTHVRQDSVVADRSRHDRARGVERFVSLGPLGLNGREGDPPPGFPVPNLLATRRSAITAAAIVGAMRLDPRVDIGHVHLKVADIDRSL